MSRPGAIEVQGVIVEVLRDKLYRVELPNGHKVLGHLAKKDLAAGLWFWRCRHSIFRGAASF